MLTIIDMLESEKELRKTVEKGYNLLVEGPTKESVDFRRGMESLYRSMTPYLDAFDEKLERLQEENEKFRFIINKAIEYLREIEMFEKKFGFDGVRRKKLLNILQGSDKE